MRKDAVGRGDVVWEEYKERNEIEGLGDMKLSGYVAVYREDMAMVMALVKFLVYNMYVVYFCLIFSHSYLIFLSLLPRFLKQPQKSLKNVGTYSKISREGSGVAQSVERLAVNQVVAGSSPAAGAIFILRALGS